MYYKSVLNMNHHTIDDLPVQYVFSNVLILVYGLHSVYFDRL